LNDLPTISGKISKDLRNEYLLGYYSMGASRDGKYHTVRVKLDLPDRTSELRTYYRRGYYAPLQ
jgi:hypothetical protein